MFSGFFGEKIQKIPLASVLPYYNKASQTEQTILEGSALQYK